MGLISPSGCGLLVYGGEGESMLISCRYCGRIHERNLDCGKKPKYKRKYKAYEKVRYTKDMRDKSKEIKRRANYLCEVCKLEGKYVYERLETHHIIKLIDDLTLALEDTNLICLCRNCHEKAEKGDIPIDFLYKITRNRPPYQL